MKEGRCNSDLFLLLLQKDVRELVEKNVTIPNKFIKRGYNEIAVDFYTGSTGNISLNSVTIRVYNKISSHIMFYIDQDGFYRNNSLIEEDFNWIINLTKTMKYGNGYYDIFKIPDRKPIIEQIKDAIDSENYKLVKELKEKLNKDV